MGKLSKLWPLLTAGILATAMASLAKTRVSAATALSVSRAGGIHAGLGNGRQTQEYPVQADHAAWREFLSATPRVPECFGVNIHFTQPRPGEMRMLAAAGFHWIRMDFGWSATERVKGHYDFRAYDHLLAALERYHIRPLWILDYGNPLYDHGLAPATPAARRAFCRWVAAAVRHFRGHGIIWEMWNEPNSSFWIPRPNARAYSKLALAVGQTIRRVAPRELYVGPALGGIDRMSFLHRCLQAGVLKYFDAVTIHPYMRPETVIPVYRKIKTLIARYEPPGRKIPIISSEWGASSRWVKSNDAIQARYLARELLVNLYQGIPLSIWYDWHNDGSNPKNSEDHFGLVYFTYHPGRNPIYRPKPAYLAVRTLATQLAGCRFVKRIKIGGADNYVLLFHGPKGNRIAAWTTSRHAHAVVLPLLSGRYRITNETGTKMRTILARANKIHLSLSHDPQYIRKRTMAFTNRTHP